MSEVANRLLVFKLSFSFPNFHHLTLSSINISPISKLNYLSMKYSFLKFKPDVHPHQISSMMTTHKTTTTTRKTTPKPTTTTPKPTTTTSTTTTTTSPPWICEDYDVAHCSDPDVNTVVCADENLVYLCRKTCNRCEVNT